MAKLGISTGTTPNDGLGDNLLAGAVKINSNFSEIYNRFGDGTNLTAIGGTWVSTSAGIHTLKNVGIGTTNPRFKLEVGAVGASGTTLFVNGDARVTGIVTIGPASITLNGISNIINVGSGVTLNGSTGSISATSIVLGGSTLTGAGVTSITAGSGISVNSSTGNVTITATGSGGSSQFVTTSAGIHTLSKVGIGTTNSTSALTVKGNTSLETLNVTGVSTFAGITTVTGTTLFTKQLNVSGVSTFNSNIRTNGSNIKLGDGNEGIGNQIKLGNGSGSLDSYGDSADLWIYHNASIGKNWIQDITSSGVEVLTGEFKVKDSSNSNTGIIVNSTFGTEIYYSNSKKLETTNAGVTVYGTISVDDAVKLITNNATIVGTSGSTGEIKRIAGAPFFYDGSAWREFVLSSGTPVAVPADTEWDNVILRSTYDTTSPDFFDFKFSEQPVKTGTGATTVASPVKIGTKSFRNNGAVGAGISYAYRAEHDFSGPWTIEFWINHDARPFLNLAFPESMVAQISSVSPTGNWSFGLLNSNPNIAFIWNNEDKVSLDTLHTVSYSTFDNNFKNQWNHYALVRESSNGSLHFYINGYEVGITTNNSIIDNEITSTNGAGLYIGGIFGVNINDITYGVASSIDAHFDDLRITTDERYVSVGNTNTQVFVPSITALPTTGTLSSYVQPPGDKYGEIGLGTSPTWRGTSGVTVSQQTSGNYRVSFASTYTNSNDYFVLSHAMDQGFASYVGIARSTTHVDFAINKESDNAVVNTGSLSVQIKNHL